VSLCAHCHMEEHGQLNYTILAAKLCSKPKPPTKCKTRAQ
jgi:hypothetical protein